MTVREQTQEIERKVLSPRAALSENTLGRDRPEELCPLRTEYQRDRDRIIHCRSFRRLKHKTQVFLSPTGDHYRTRLTHTLEVNQIARTIGRALRLNEDLIEAIALGHDLGHTPFGHAGERALRQVSPFYFNHNEHSVRVVEQCEKNGRGLNLTVEVRNGILCHTTSLGMKAMTLEGRVVQFSDRIAYVNHDIEDAILAGILKEEDIPADITAVLGAGKSRRITSLVTSVIEHSQEDVLMGEEQLAAYKQLYNFLFKNVYQDSAAKKEEKKAERIIVSLYQYLKDNPEYLPEEYHATADREGIDRAVTDYIASMSDSYVMSVYSDLFIPKGWKD